MVPPCLGSRISSSGANDSYLSKITRKAIVDDSAPPTEFQFSAETVKVCGQPKHWRGQGVNGITSDARRLGNVRTALLNSGNEEVLLIRKSKSRRASNGVGSDSSSKTSKRRAKKSPESTEGMETTGREKSPGKDICFAANDELERRRRMAATLTKMLGTSPTRVSSFRRKSVPGFHEQHVPDARNDPYQIHKWRRRSSRKKYAGMEASPTAIPGSYPVGRDDESMQRRFRSDTDLKNVHGYYSEFAANEHTRKPRVPLPGINMLPALDVYNRSENGASGREEVTLKFARNIAMEELERRFHDDKWKTKRVRKGSQMQPTEHQSFGDLTRETRRIYALRRAASLRTGGQREQDMQRDSAMQMLESLMESPDKGPVNDDAQNMSTPVLSGENSLTALGNSDMNGTKTEGRSLLTGAVKFKMIEDSLSEETVTIVSKLSEALSPTKRSTPGFSKTSLILSGVSDYSGTEIPTVSGISSKPRQLSRLSHQPAPRPTERRFPRLPDFPKSGKTSFQDGETLFNHLQQNMIQQNEEQYRKFSRSKEPGERNEVREKARERRTALPPLLGPGAKQVDPAVTKPGKRKARISDAERSNENDSLSPLGASPTRKKVVHSNKTSPLSYASSHKGSSTPVDSTTSHSTTGGRRKSKNWRRRSTRGENKGSPQFQKAQRQTKMAKLMGKWRTAIRLTVLVNRLCNDHYMISDDSYNIHTTRLAGSFSGIDSKQEVFFDVTDYKMKNQQKLSETTRRVLSMPSEERTNVDVRMVQTTLRNLKAISDHSAVVQSNIARYGYFAGFESKRVIVLENRRPLNFYVLLAGSAVIIKEDESGNTNPILFMKRGDIFGEREILDNGNWEYSVVTVDPCEFLVLDRSDYVRIFLAGGAGGLLNDPDRGAFLKSLALFQGWPTQLLDSNPNRCLFRYYKRGALLVRDDSKSDWIFVVKSGSCSVLKPLRVQPLTSSQILRKQLEEQTAVFPKHWQEHLVEKEEDVTEEEQIERINEISKIMKAEQVSVATSYHQIEMASLLKELNIEIKDGILSPLDEEDEEEEEGGEENKETIRLNRQESKIPLSITEGEMEAYVETNTSNGEFRMSRVSDRVKSSRTPSPMKAAYLQTGLSSPRKEDSQRMLHDENLRKEMEERKPPSLPNKREVDERTEKETTITDPDDFLSKLDTASVSETVAPVTKEELKPVYVNVRKLTKGSTFGLDSFLFNDQPSLALVSNGAECLVMHKKFYLDNMTDAVLKKLREAEHPYPTEDELMEDYWRLVSWKWFQKRTVRDVFRRKARVKHYLSPRKTGVY